MSHPTFLQSLDCTSCWDPAVKQTRHTSSGHGEGRNKPVTGIFMKCKINSHILYISTKCQSMALSYVEFYFKRHFEALQFIPCPESMLSLFAYRQNNLLHFMCFGNITDKNIKSLYLYMYKLNIILITLLRVNLNQNFTDKSSSMSCHY